MKPKIVCTAFLINSVSSGVLHFLSRARTLGGSVGEETAAVSNLFKNKAAAGNDMGRSGRHVCTLVKHKKGAEQKLLGVQRRRTHTNQAAAPRHATDSSPAGDQRSGVCRADQLVLCKSRHLPPDEGICPGSN
jgi:hypothetical protein